MSSVPWPGRGSRGKGSCRRKEPQHQKSTATLVHETGIYYQSKIGDDYSLQSQINKFKPSNKQVQLLKSSNPFEMPSDISFEKPGRFSRTQLDPDVERKPRLSKRFTPPPVRTFSDEEKIKLEATLRASTMLSNARSYLTTQYQSGKFHISILSDSLRLLKG